MSMFLKPSRMCCAIMALVLCHGAGAASNLPRYGVLVYSSFCVSPMSGDLGGDRITLHRFSDGDTLVYEYTDGSTHALIAHDLVLDTAAGTLRFAVDPHNEATSTIAGAISRDGDRITVQGLPFRGDLARTLVRVKNVAAPIRQCR
jgi:hypothetical protein